MRPATLLMACGLSVGVTAATVFAARPEMTTALFSTEQLLWPQLRELQAHQTPQVQPAFQAQQMPRPARDSDTLHLAAPPRTVSIFVLPPSPPRLDEQPPCDSCDRLTPNVLEFFLPHWHREWLEQLLRSQGDTSVRVEVLSAGHPLMQGDSTLTSDVPDAPSLPWARWFPPSEGQRQSLIYRPRDRWVQAKSQARLSALGGRLGATHLLLIDSVSARVRPWTRSSERGSFTLAYSLLLWNVPRGQPEWALRLRLHGGIFSDLDAPLEPKLEPALKAWSGGLPEALRALLAAEPQ